jgi:uncharacterized protein (TIGR03083 family)
VLLAENLASIESEGHRLAAAVRTNPTLPVPQYPEWTLADLASHTGSIHARTIEICRTLPTERISAPKLPEGRDPVEWFEETLEEMLAVLTEADPETPVWGFGPNPTIGFWERRMVIETGVHRWDASQATGRDEPLTLHVARSGLEEFADMWLPMLGEVPALRVTVVDLAESWTYGDGVPELEISGDASDLYLALVARPSGIELPETWAEAVGSLRTPPKP